MDEAKEEDEDEVDKDAIKVDCTRDEGRILLILVWGNTKPWATKGRKRSRAARRLREDGECAAMERRGEELGRKWVAADPCG